MAWVKQSDRLWCDAEFCALSDGAQALWHRANSYLADHLLDGVLPEGALKFLSTRKRYVDELVRAGRWVWQPSGGWLAVGWQEIIQSKAQVVARRSQTLQRVRGHRNAVTNAGCNAYPGPGPGPELTEEELERVKAPRISETRSSARSDSETWIAGRDWFVTTVLNGDAAQAPDCIKWRDDYAALGRKPAAERVAAAKTASADPWVQANRRSANPGHFVKHWGRYVSGGPKMVERAPSSREQAEADQKASAASKLVKLRDEYAARIKKARDDGDTYTAEILAAERDGRLARLQTQAS